MLRLSDDTNVAVQDGSLFYIHVYDFKKKLFSIPSCSVVNFLILAFFLSDIQLCIRPFRAIVFSYRLQIWINLNLKKSFPKLNFLCH